MVSIDGGAGEGGGQVVRTALALSLVTGQPVAVDNVRAGRESPGLKRQHLAAVRAAAEIGGAEVKGDFLGSTSLRFVPGTVRPGRYRWDVGSAGSTSLVLQTVLWPLARADGPSRVEIVGGTHAMAAPPWHFLERTFAPAARAIGLGLEVGLGRWGFFPAGGGEVWAEILPGELRRWELGPCGLPRRLVAFAATSALDPRIGRRELAAIGRSLPIDGARSRSIDLQPPTGPGNIAWVEVESGGLVELCSACGRRGLRAEAVAAEVVAQVEALLAAQAAVGPYLADQLLLPLALGQGGRFFTVEPTLHTRTQAEVLHRFLGTQVSFRPEGAGWWVEVEPER